MRWFLLALPVLLFSVATPAYSTPDTEDDERLYSYFEIHLMEMATFLPGKADVYGSFVRLKSESEESANFLAMFWQSKARTSNLAAIKSAVASTSDKLVRDFGSERALKQVEKGNVMYEATKFIYMGYYFDEWDKIKESIDGRLAAVKSDPIAKRLEELRAQRDDWFRKNGASTNGARGSAGKPNVFAPSLPER